MTRVEAASFARAWISAWSRRDLAALLARFSEDGQFASPKARLAVGTAVLRGKTAVAQYWRTALAKNPAAEFIFERVVWDAATRDLVVFYDVGAGHERTRACELMRFDEQGLVISDEALYGVPR